MRFKKKFHGIRSSKKKNNNNNKWWNSKYQNIPFGGSSGSSDKNGLTPHETLTTSQRQGINFRACMEMGSHISLKEGD